jgi:hypothetical protein
VPLAEHYSATVNADSKTMDAGAVARAVAVEGTSSTLTVTWTDSFDAQNATPGLGLNGYSVPPMSLSGTFEIRDLSVVMVDSQPLSVVDQDNHIVWRGEVDVKATWHGQPSKFDFGAYANSPYGAPPSPGVFDYLERFKLAASDTGGQYQSVGDDGQPIALTPLSEQRRGYSTQLPGCDHAFGPRFYYLYPLSTALYNACVAANPDRNANGPGGDPCISAARVGSR